MENDRAILQRNQQRNISANCAERQPSEAQLHVFIDNRPGALSQRLLHDRVNSSAAMLAQRKTLELVQRKRVSDGAVLGSINSKDYPESVGHIKDAIGSGHASQVTVMRGGAKQNRRQSLKGIPTQKGYDRDEYPMAMFNEGGSGASVRYIDPSDNRGAGSSIGHMLSGEPDNTVVDVNVIAEKNGSTTIQL